MIILLVIAGATIGAPARYLTDRYIQARHDTSFPWGTLTVNVVGSFVLGLLFAGAHKHGWSPRLMAFAGTGFCGALTTFSTFSYETLWLFQTGARLYAVANVVTSIAAGFDAAILGAVVAGVL